MWDERYNTEDYVYGKTPNDFLVDNIEFVQPGKVLCLAEGEGRNAVFLAKRGFEVIAVDSSAVGLRKTEALAVEAGVTIETVVSDLADYRIEPESLRTVVSIFCHVPPETRKDLYQRIMTGLKPGGTIILEAYTPAQLHYGTGGPPKIELLVTLEMLQEDLAGAEFLIARELDREVIEGSLHTGMGAVVQIVARKP